MERFDLVRDVDEADEELEGVLARWTAKVSEAKSSLENASLTVILDVILSLGTDEVLDVRDVMTFLHWRAGSESIIISTSLGEIRYSRRPCLFPPDPPHIDGQLRVGSAHARS
jgi:hypothetical protein